MRRLFSNPVRTVASLATVLVLLVGAGQAQASFLCLPPCECLAPAAFFGFLLLTSSGQPPTDDSSLDQPCLQEQGSAYVHVFPQLTETVPGVTFDVAFVADFSHEIVSFGFHVEYDESILRLAELHIAPAFRELPSLEAGQAAGLAYPQAAIGTDILIATARFTALDVGTSDIAIAVEGGDPTEGFAQRECGFATFGSTPGRVVVSKVPDPIPEPAAIVFALATMPLLRRRWTL